VDRIKAESTIRRAAAAEKVNPPTLLGAHIKIIQKKADLELARAREAQKAAQSYDSLFNVEEDEIEPLKTGKALEEDFI
jgi:uncharacterized protein YhbP (UPF0306 family)